MTVMNNLSRTMDAVRMADVASMQEAVLELRSLASRARPAKSLPPLAFALRYGVVPPVLAGRAKEMAILRSLVSFMLEAAPPPPSIKV